MPQIPFDVVAFDLDGTLAFGFSDRPVDQLAADAVGQSYCELLPLLAKL